MFLIIALLLIASGYVSNAKLEDGIKVGVNVVIILILLLMLVFDNL